MAKEGTVRLRAASRRLLWASFLALGLVGAAGAFGIGFTGSLQESLNDPQSAPVQRVSHLDAVEAALGPDAFQKNYRAYLLTGDSAYLTLLARDAKAADAEAAAFAKAGSGARDTATMQALAPLLAFYRKAATGQGSIPSETEIARTFMLMKSEIQKARENAAADRIQGLTRALAFSQAASVAALALLATTLFSLAWFIRTRLSDPIEQLRRACVSAAYGAHSQPLWGKDRKDEIGRLARAADILRVALSDAREGTPKKLTLVDTPVTHIFAKLVERLAKDAQRLETDLATISNVTSAAKGRIESASLQAAYASKAAVEAASLARDGAKAALKAGPQPRGPAMETLMQNLDALEIFIRERPSMRGEEAVRITSALIDAIDRLNGIAERVAITADRGSPTPPTRAAE